MSKWTEVDQVLARQEGWYIQYGVLWRQYSDDGITKFTSTWGAIAHVINSAIKGSEFHERALQHIAAFNGSHWTTTTELLSRSLYGWDLNSVSIETLSSNLQCPLHRKALRALTVKRLNGET